MRRPVTAYATAFAALVGAVLLRWLLDPVMGDALPLVTLFGAVAAAVWVAGYGPALVVAILGYLACHYLFIPPRGAFLFDVPNAVGLVAYIFTCGLIIGIGEAMRRAQVRAAERGERERLALHEAAAANAKFRAFFDQGALFAAIMHVDGTILEPNRLSGDGCGFTREQIVGKPFWEGPWWAPSPILTEQIKEAFARAGPARRTARRCPTSSPMAASG